MAICQFPTFKWLGDRSLFPFTMASIYHLVPPLILSHLSHLPFPLLASLSRLPPPHSTVLPSPISILDSPISILSLVISHLTNSPLPSHVSRLPLTPLALMSVHLSAEVLAV